MAANRLNSILLKKDKGFIDDESHENQNDLGQEEEHKA